MRAAGKIVDPHAWGRFPVPDGGKPGLIGRFLQWSRRVGETSTTEGVLRQHLAKKFMKDQFNHGLFLSNSADDFRSLLQALSTGSVATLDKKVGPMLTEPARQVIVRGMEESRAENGGVAQGVEVVQAMEQSYVSARLIFPPVTSGSPGLRQRPTHAQITTQYKLLVRPIGILPEGSSAAASMARNAASASSSSSAASSGSAKSRISSLIGGGNSSKKASTPSPLSPSSSSSASAASAVEDESSMAAQMRMKREEEWEPVIDEATGLQYWVLGAGHGLGYAGGNTSDWLRTWTAPQGNLLLPKRSWRIETAGIQREPVTVALPDTGAEDRLVRVTHRVTWERAIPPPAAEVMASSPATARWRIVRLQ